MMLKQFMGEKEKDQPSRPVINHTKYNAWNRIQILGASVLPDKQ